jgi:hypothetical protein
MTVATALSSTIYLLGALLIGGAVLVFVFGPSMLTRFGYTPEALTNVVAGRFIAIAAMTSLMTFFQQWLGLAILMGCGALLALIDMYFVQKAAGPAWPHATAAVVCVGLAVGAYALSPA